MIPTFDDDAMAQALDDADGHAPTAAAAIGCSPATMYAFKRRVAWTATERAPRPRPERPAAPPSPPPAPMPGAIRAQLHATVADGTGRSAFDVACDELPAVPKPIPEWIERPYFAEVRALLDEGEAVLLIGHAGGGKTMTAQQDAALCRHPYFRAAIDGNLEFRTLWGRQTIIAEEGASRLVFVESQCLAVCETAGAATLLIDEVNMADPNKINILNRLYDSRTYYISEARGGRGRTLQVPEGVRLLAACNPPLAQFSGAQRLNAALANRFVHVEVPPLSRAEVETLARRFGAPKAQHDWIVEMFDQAQRMVIGQGLRVQVSIRNLRSICRMTARGVKLGRAVELSILNACIATGDATGREALAGLVKTVIGKEGGAV